MMQRKLHKPTTFIASKRKLIIKISLLKLWCSAAYSRPCTPICPHVRTACLHLVPRHCHRLLSGTQVCKHRLASVLSTLSDWSCRSDLVVVGRSCGRLSTRLALQLARVISHSVVVLRTRKHSPIRARCQCLRAVYPSRANRLSGSGAGSCL